MSGLGGQAGQPAGGPGRGGPGRGGGQGRGRGHGQQGGGRGQGQARGLGPNTRRGRGSGTHHGVRASFQVSPSVSIGHASLSWTHVFSAAGLNYPATSSSVPPGASSSQTQPQPVSAHPQATLGTHVQTNTSLPPGTSTAHEFSASPPSSVRTRSSPPQEPTPIRVYGLPTEELLALLFPPSDRMASSTSGPSLFHATDNPVIEDPDFPGYSTEQTSDIIGVDREVAVLAGDLTASTYMLYHGHLLIFSKGPHFHLQYITARDAYFQACVEIRRRIARDGNQPEQHFEYPAFDHRVFGLVISRLRRHMSALIQDVRPALIEALGIIQVIDIATTAGLDVSAVIAAHVDSFLSMNEHTIRFRRTIVGLINQLRPDCPSFLQHMAFDDSPTALWENPLIDEILRRFLLGHSSSFARRWPHKIEASLLRNAVSASHDGTLATLLEWRTGSFQELSMERIQFLHDHFQSLRASFLAALAEPITGAALEQRIIDRWDSMCRTPSVETYNSPVLPISEPSAPDLPYDMASNIHILVILEACLSELSRVQTPETVLSDNDAQPMQEDDREDDEESPQDTEMGEVEAKRRQIVKNLKIEVMTRRLRRRLREETLRRSRRLQFRDVEEHSTPSLEQAHSLESGADLAHTELAFFDSSSAAVPSREPEEHQENMAPQGSSSHSSPRSETVLRLSDLVNPEYIGSDSPAPDRDASPSPD